MAHIHTHAPTHTFLLIFTLMYFHSCTLKLLSLFTLLHQSAPLFSQVQEDANFDLMKQYILDSVIKKKDIFTTSKPQELEYFHKLFKAKGPFDIVIDGLNMAFSNTPGHIHSRSPRSQVKKLESMQVQSQSHLPSFPCPSTLQVRDVVLHFANQGLKVLLVSRKRVKMYRDYNEIASRATVLALDNVREAWPVLIPRNYLGNDPGPLL